MASDDEWCAPFFKSDEDEAATGLAKDPRVLDKEEWEQMWADPIRDVFYWLKERAVLQGALLDTLTLAAFEQFCFENSSGYPLLA